MEETSSILPQEPEIVVFIPKKLPQYVAALVATIGAFGLGTVLGWTSPALPSMAKSGDFPGFESDSDEATWISALTPIGALVAGFASGYSIQKIGQKGTMLLLAAPFVAGWLMMAYAKTLSLIMVGRFITGFCGGSFSLLIPVYVSEIAETEIRGLLSNTLVLVLCIGILFTYIVGAVVTWQWLCIISASVPVILAIGMVFMPESPRFLLSKGRPGDARMALRWLRGGSTEDVEPEMKLIARSLEENQAQSVSIRDLLAGPVLKPTGISLMLMFLQQFGGINVVIFYSVEIFQDAGTGIDANLSAIIIAAVQVLFVFVSTLLVERLGRKILLVVSDLGMGISLLMLGVYFYLKEHDTGRASSLGWLPLTSLILYIITYNLALGPLPWTMMGELLPPHVKGLTASIATAFNYFLAFIITKFFPSMTAAMTSYGCYWLFSAVSFFGFVFCLVLVPETKGKSLDEIQRYFGRR
ncbi:unnamed protein product [Allacma fusca]|uniref:Major facilitator superfamily (MFS) profile domain-containing protein n=1 Tax=Allacma fusca TaxID=39272 RepID=A0A8J2J2B7_9HEXA|nr:unnamed protein product [Allacma fusca]